MAVAFHPGTVLGENDLKIIIRDSSGNLKDPFYIRYSLFDFTTGEEILIGPEDRIPATTGVGHYHVNATIPLDANVGTWTVRWHFREDHDSPLVQVVQEFAIVKAEIITKITDDDTSAYMIKRLRIVLRDNNPDRNYRFRPPETDRFIQAQAQVFGYIWEDEELYEYLLMAVDLFNSAPPVTRISLERIPSRWRTVVLQKAAAIACMAVAMNWVSDEFSYSISGVSLDINKSAQYQSMKSMFEEEFDKSLDMAKRSIKIIKGLQQPKYGIGVSSALGPYSRPGVQSRRNFVSGAAGWS